MGQIKELRSYFNNKSDFRTVKDLLGEYSETAEDIAEILQEDEDENASAYLIKFPNRSAKLLNQSKVDGKVIDTFLVITPIIGIALRKDEKDQSGMFGFYRGYGIHYEETFLVYYQVSISSSKYLESNSTIDNDDVRNILKKVMKNYSDFTLVQDGDLKNTLVGLNLDSHFPFYKYSGKMTTYNIDKDLNKVSDHIKYCKTMTDQISEKFMAYFINYVNYFSEDYYKSKQEISFNREIRGR